MRIGYFADGPWSYRAFQHMISDTSIEICFIVPRSDSSDKTLYQYAADYKIPYIKGYNINSNEFYDIVSSYNCDLFVSMSFNQIFRKRITELPKLGTINCHAGKLPFYRGRNILNWVLINDEKEFGITVHFIDEGIDTGDIILQKTFPIRDNDTYATLLEIAFVECGVILYESIKLIQQNSFFRIKQAEIDPVGFYCGQRKEGDENIDWNQSSRDLFNFIRAISKPGPCATTKFNNKPVKINKAEMLPDARNYKSIPGQIVGKLSSGGYIVKTGDTVIIIMDLQTDDGIKLKIGDRFDL